MHTLQVLQETTLQVHPVQGLLRASRGPLSPQECAVRPLPCLHSQQAVSREVLTCAVVLYGVQQRLTNAGQQQDSHVK